MGGMTITNPRVKTLLELYQEIQQLEHIQALLGWDQNTYMPAAAASGRASQSALLAQYLSRKWNDTAFKSTLEKVDEDSLNEDEQDMVRVLRERAKFYLKVPEKLVIALSKETGEAFSVWHEARSKNDFAAFAPHLTRLVALEQEVAEHLGFEEDPYDALLDLYEPELTYTKAHAIFARLQPALTQMIQKITQSERYAHATSLRTASQSYDIDKQEALSQHMMKLMGYPLDRGRLDVSPHPFTTTLGFDDVRITTRYAENDWLSSYSSTIHEGGHALYELGIDPEYRDTPFATGVSLGVHESQSRFWENMIGKNEIVLQALASTFEKYLGEQIEAKDLGLFANYVQPGLIRVEADEVTYNLHILLRMELEHELLHNTLDVKDLPSAWAAKMKEYLGVTVADDRDGCLQDVHWSYGSFGYFPTYTIGNLYSASILAAIQRDLDWSEQLKQLRFEPIRDWLRTHIHRHGARFLPEKLMRQNGIELGADDYLSYIQDKYSALYDVSL